MADQVTISTFLELKDNLSPGLAKVEAALQRMTQQAALMNGALTRAAGALRPMDAGFKTVDTHLKNALAHANKLSLAVKGIKPPKLPAIPPSRGGGGGGGGGGGAGGGGVFRGGRGVLDPTSIASGLVAYGLHKAVHMAGTFAIDTVKKAIEVNVEYEKSISAISAAMYTMGASPAMDIAEAHSSRVVTKLREMAAVLPGEAAEYVEVFQRTIPNAFASGMRDSMKYADFVSKYTAVAIQRGVSAKIAATNLQILLQGTARAGTKMAQVLSVYTGKTINEINKMTRAARFELLQQATEQAAAGMEASKTKADAIFGELKSHMEELYRLGGQPIFDAAKNGAKELNTWLVTNKSAIVELGKTLTTEVADVLRGIVTIGMKMVDVAKMIRGGEEGDPRARLAALQSPFSASNIGTRLASTLFPFYGIPAQVGRIGEMKRLQEQIKKEDDIAAANRERAKIYKPLEETYRFGGIGAGMPAAMIADQAQEMIRSGMFSMLRTKTEQSLSEYLKYKGVSEEDIQRVHDELIGRGVFKLTAAPEDRTKPPVNDFRYSRFDIRQEFAEGFDPDRIAAAFATDLNKMADKKLNAASALPVGGR